MTPFPLPTADAMPHLGETDSQDISAWLRLANASGLPPIALCAWLAEFGGPPALLTMPDPPPLLYVKSVKGRLDLLQARAVAIVGSRSTTPQGIEDARRFAHALSDAGLAVVSGLVLGTDGAAHRGGLSGSGGTIAVIGTGADLIYPSLHHALAHEIATNGTIVSEWPNARLARRPGQSISRSVTG